IYRASSDLRQIIRRGAMCQAFSQGPVCESRVATPVDMSGGVAARHTIVVFSYGANQRVDHLLAYELLLQIATRIIWPLCLENDQKSCSGCPRAVQHLQERMQLMSLHDFPRLRRELECHVRARTGNRLRNLDIQLAPDGILLQGRTSTYYVKQLAQHGIRDVLPDVQLHNAIEVA